MPDQTYSVTPVGFVRSELKDRKNAPRQGYEGAPDAWLELIPSVADALKGIAVGEDLVLITWFHLAARDVLTVHPRDDASNPLTGVFLTRSPDRPNPVGLHRVQVLEVDGTRLR
ncbi:MAG TPA: TrmO family methyltransferase, partial [Candidatus Eisenbacteria bacterium]|nr:TrmO family methyltransferase [Candidatus Eisenbacteria bacterium]